MDLAKVDSAIMDLHNKPATMVFETMDSEIIGSGNDGFRNNEPRNIGLCNDRPQNNYLRNNGLRSNKFRINEPCNNAPRNNELRKNGHNTMDPATIDLTIMDCRK